MGTLILITYALDGVKEDLSSGGSRPSDNGGGAGGGGGHPDPQIRGRRSPKIFFRPFVPQFGLKIRGGGGLP